MGLKIADDAVDERERRAEVRLVVGERREERVWVPRVAGRLRRDQGRVVEIQLGGERQDVGRRCSAPVDRDEDKSRRRGVAAAAQHRLSTVRVGVHGKILTSMADQERWPAVPTTDFHETCATLHMWTQIAGKICLALTPRTNHFWNIAFQVTPRGLATPAMPYRDGA